MYFASSLTVIAAVMNVKELIVKSCHSAEKILNFIYSNDSKSLILTYITVKQM